jgi:selenide,water dikinase
MPSNPRQTPFARDLVLAGGGHAHLGVLRDLARRGAPAGLRVTLLARESEALYSGMLPGLIAGRFTRDECVLDLPRLARAAGARFIGAEVTGLDRASGELLLAGGRPPLRYDLLSLNLGAVPALVPGAAEHALPLRPFDRFLAGWHALLARAAEAKRALRVLVVGAGAAGLEVALGLRQRLGDRAEIALLCRGEAPLPRQTQAAREAAARALGQAGVTLVAHTVAARVERGAVIATDGRSLPFDAALWAAGAAPPGWLRASGLELCPRGFVAVDATLRSMNDPRVFAAGDVATVLPHPRERAGVYAVRQGAALAENLRRAAEGRRLKPFRPQRSHLALLATGAARAIATRGGLVLEGGWALRLKDRIDRRWIAMHRAMSPMGSAAPAMPADAMRCGGCGAKLPAAVLSRVLGRLPRGGAREGVVLGLAAPDDAALLRPAAPGHLLVQTVDQFRAMVDDPFLFGRIAAAHALGDIAAMGAEPRAALAIAALPPAAEPLLEDDLLAMLTGAAELLEGAGAELVGGHSAEALEPMLGFALTGEVEAGRELRRGSLRAGDRLILTKPLGTGILLAGAAAGVVPARDLDGALRVMQASPMPAARILRALGARGCADVTGFGLLNHLGEMLEASGLGARLDPLAVPALPGTLRAIEVGIRSTLRPGNAAAARPRLGEGWPEVLPARFELLLDPQTAGGLLAGVPEAAVEPCLAALRDAGSWAACIGEVVDGPPRIHAAPPAPRAGSRAEPSMATSR